MDEQTAPERDRDDRPQPRPPPPPKFKLVPKKKDQPPPTDAGKDPPSSASGSTQKPRLPKGPAKVPPDHPPGSRRRHHSSKSAGSASPSPTPPRAQVTNAKGAPTSPDTSDTPSVERPRATGRDPPKPKDLSSSLPAQEDEEEIEEEEIDAQVELEEDDDDEAGEVDLKSSADESSGSKGSKKVGKHARKKEKKRTKVGKVGKAAEKKYVVDKDEITKTWKPGESEYRPLPQFLSKSDDPEPMKMSEQRHFTKHDVAFTGEVTRIVDGAMLGYGLLNHVADHPLVQPMSAVKTPTSATHGPLFASIFGNRLDVARSPMTIGVYGLSKCGGSFDAFLAGLSPNPHTATLVKTDKIPRMHRGQEPAFKLYSGSARKRLIRHLDPKLDPLLSGFRVRLMKMSTSAQAMKTHEKEIKEEMRRIEHWTNTAFTLRHWVTCFFDAEKFPDTEQGKAAKISLQSNLRTFQEERGPNERWRLLAVARATSVWEGATNVKEPREGQAWMSQYTFRPLLQHLCLFPGLCDILRGPHILPYVQEPAGGLYALILTTTLTHLEDMVTSKITEVENGVEAPIVLRELISPAFIATMTKSYQTHLKPHIRRGGDFTFGNDARSPSGSPQPARAEPPKPGEKPIDPLSRKGEPGSDPEEEEKVTCTASLYKYGLDLKMGLFGELSRFEAAGAGLGGLNPRYKAAAADIRENIPRKVIAYLNLKHPFPIWCKEWCEDVWWQAETRGPAFALLAYTKEPAFVFSNPKIKGQNFKKGCPTGCAFDTLVGQMAIRGDGKWLPRALKFADWAFFNRAVVSLSDFALGKIITLDGILQLPAVPKSTKGVTAKDSSDVGFKELVRKVAQSYFMAMTHAPATVTEIHILASMWNPPEPPKTTKKGKGKAVEPRVKEKELERLEAVGGGEIRDYMLALLRGSIMSPKVREWNETQRKAFAIAFADNAWSLLRNPPSWWSTLYKLKSFQAFEQQFRHARKGALCTPEDYFWKGFGLEKDPEPSAFIDDRIAVTAEYDERFYGMKKAVEDAKSDVRDRQKEAKARKADKAVSNPPPASKKRSAPKSDAVPKKTPAANKPAAPKKTPTAKPRATSPPPNRVPADLDLDSDRPGSAATSDSEDIDPNTAAQSAHSDSSRSSSKRKGSQGSLSPESSRAPSVDKRPRRGTIIGDSRPLTQERKSEIDPIGAHINSLQLTWDRVRPMLTNRPIWGNLCAIDGLIGSALRAAIQSVIQQILMGDTDLSDSPQDERLELLFGISWSRAIAVASGHDTPPVGSSVYIVPEEGFQPDEILPWATGLRAGRPSAYPTIDDAARNIITTPFSTIPTLIIIHAVLAILSPPEPSTSETTGSDEVAQMAQWTRVTPADSIQQVEEILVNHLTEFRSQLVGIAKDTDLANTDRVEKEQRYATERLASLEPTGPTTISSSEEDVTMEDPVALPQVSRETTLENDPLRTPVQKGGVDNDDRMSGPAFSPLQLGPNRPRLVVKTEEGNVLVRQTQSPSSEDAQMVDGQLSPHPAAGDESMNIEGQFNDMGFDDEQDTEMAVPVPEQPGPNILDEYRLEEMIATQEKAQDEASGPAVNLGDVIHSDSWDTTREGSIRQTPAPIPFTHPPIPVSSHPSLPSTVPDVRSSQNWRATAPPEPVDPTQPKASGTRFKTSSSQDWA